MTWHVFNMDATAPFASFARKAEAVHDAQCRLDTERRPKRLFAGYYELFGEKSQYDIATTEVADRQGFDWAKRVGTFAGAIALWNEQQEMRNHDLVDRCFALRKSGFVPGSRISFYGIEAEIASFPFPSNYGSSIMVKLPDESPLLRKIIMSHDCSKPIPDLVIEAAINESSMEPLKEGGRAQ